MATNVPYVIDGVYTIALGLHQLIEDYCGKNETQLCAEAERNLDMLYHYMKDLRFYNGITNLTVSYDALGNGIPRYRVFNYQRDPGGSYNYQPVRKTPIYIIICEPSIICFKCNSITKCFS